MIMRIIRITSGCAYEPLLTNSRHFQNSLNLQSVIVNLCYLNALLFTNKKCKFDRIYYCIKKYLYYICPCEQAKKIAYKKVLYMYTLLLSVPFTSAGFSSCSACSVRKPAYRRRTYLLRSAAQRRALRKVAAGAVRHTEASTDIWLLGKNDFESLPPYQLCSMAGKGV